MNFLITLTLLFTSAFTFANSKSGLCLFVDKRLASDTEITLEASSIYLCNSEEPADAYDYYIYKLKKISSEQSVGSINKCVFIYDREPDAIALIDDCLSYPAAMDYDYTVLEVL